MGNSIAAKSPKSGQEYTIKDSVPCGAKGQKANTELRSENVKKGDGLRPTKEKYKRAVPALREPPPLLMAKPTALAVCRYDSSMRPVGDRPKKQEPLKSLFSKAEGFLCNGEKMRRELIHIYREPLKAFRFAPIFALLRYSQN